MAEKHKHSRENSCLSPRERPVSAIFPNPLDPAQVSAHSQTHTVWGLAGVASLGGTINQVQQHLVLQYETYFKGQVGAALSMETLDHLVLLGGGGKNKRTLTGRVKKSARGVKIQSAAVWGLFLWCILCIRGKKCCLLIQNYPAK